ncbi:MAG: exopolysaccharide biosynthesis polyprenyl glycosylphosphotransferase, partial [Actinomycetes bacterium]
AVQPHHHVVGLLTDEHPDPVVIDLRREHPTVERLGPVGVALQAARAARAGTVVVSTPDVGLDRTQRLVRALTRDGRRVEVVTGLEAVGTHRLRRRSDAGGITLHIGPVGRCTWRAPLKRLLDLCCASLALLVVAPVLLVAAAAVRLGDGHGVIFRQTRVGRDGNRFTMLKLRTMTPDAERQLDGLLHRNEASGPMFKLRDDPRVTRVGRFLRSTSIDELPQLWNVLRGDMSLVGPRPALPREATQWEPGVRERLRVRPGITGPWQVHGRFTAKMEDYERLDVGYVDNWSLWGDLILLLRTIPVVIGRRGAA